MQNFSLTSLLLIFLVFFCFPPSPQFYYFPSSLHPHFFIPSSSFSLFLIPSSTSFFNIFFHPQICRPYIDPTSTLHSTMIFSFVNSETIYLFPFSLHYHHHHHISIFFFPPPAPHFYCFLSATTTTLLFFLSTSISIIFPQTPHFFIPLVVEIKL